MGVWRMAIATAVASLPLGTPAFANDSTAELGTGGLDFVQNENVEMRSEQLFVSTEQIRVTYRFFNKSDQPVTNLVAFCCGTRAGSGARGTTPRAAIPSGLPQLIHRQP